MAYTEEEARQLVLKAGLELVREKLIARTWGNISARISDSQFIITPSGISYDVLKPEDLVKVNIEDLGYEGDLKPSSEKGIHANCYKMRKDVNFVIHTHQVYATVISITGENYSFAPCAGYALPGTKGLCKKVTKCLENNPKAVKVLLRRHGALFLGTSYDNAFALAKELEEESCREFEKRKVQASEKKCRKSFLDDYAQIVGPKCRPMDGEDKDAVELIAGKNAMAACYGKNAKPMGWFDVRLQNYIYKNKYSKLKDLRK